MGHREESDHLKSLDARIAAAEKQMGGKHGKGGRKSGATLPPGGAALMARVATELVAGVVVGGFIGWVLDKQLGTTPLLMIVLFFLGAAAGMMNVWRMARGYGLKAGYPGNIGGKPDNKDKKQDQ